MIDDSENGHQLTLVLVESLQVPNEHRACIMLLEQRFNNEGSITRVEQTFFLVNDLVHIPDQGTLIDVLDGLPL